MLYTGGYVTLFCACYYKDKCYVNNLAILLVMTIFLCIKHKVLFLQLHLHC